MIANVQYEIQIVDTHESLETLVNAGVAAGTSQFNRTLVAVIMGHIRPDFEFMKEPIIYWHTTC